MVRLLRRAILQLLVTGALALGALSVPASAIAGGSQLLLLNLDLAFETPADRDAAVDRTIDILRARVAETIGADPVIWRYREGDTLILLGVPDTADIERVKGVAVRPGRLSLRLIDDTVPVEQAMAGKLPPDRQLLPAAADLMPFLVVENLVWVEGDSIVAAQAATADYGPNVNFRLDSAGTEALAAVTRDHIGRRLAIVLDGTVISAPVIQSPIAGGSGMISGDLTLDAATDLALLLRSGALPGPLSIVKQHRVDGPPPVRPVTPLQ